MSDLGDKTNGLGTDPLQRLASFKAPRDLSLGGVKPNKKVFVPNLNVTRSKNKGSASTNNRVAKEKDEKEKRNKKDKKFGPGIIKSSGVFSEGLGSAETTKFFRGRSYSRESDTKTSIQKPTIRIKDVIKIDKELEEQKINSIVGNSNEDDDGVEEFNRMIDIDVPVKLPMDDGWLHGQNKPSVKMKQEVIVKTEPSDDTDCPMPEQTDYDEKPLPGEFEDTNTLNLLKSDKPTLILLQLPDSLPGRGGRSTKEEDRAHRQTNAMEQDSEPLAESSDNRCRLSDLEEGPIGKLQVRRSGRVTLKLGDTMFEVCPGTKPAFHQEAVSIGVDDKSRSANLVVLGSLQHKLNVVPEWQALFNNMAV